MPDSPPKVAKVSAWFRLALAAALIVTATAILLAFRERLDIHALAAREMQLREQVQAHPLAALAIAFAVYVVVTGLSLPGGAAMSVLYGWLFGFWRAIVLVSFASTAGATIAMLVSRYLIGQWIQSRYGERLSRLNAAIEREGAFYLLTLRLIPQVPFFVLNALMGLTRMRVRTYWWVSQLGMLPATIVFVLAGASAPSLKTVAAKGLASLLDWRLAAALILLSGVAAGRQARRCLGTPASNVIFGVPVGRRELVFYDCPPAAQPAADCQNDRRQSRRQRRGLRRQESAKNEPESQIQEQAAETELQPLPRHARDEQRAEQRPAH